MMLSRAADCLAASVFKIQGRGVKKYQVHSLEKILPLAKDLFLISSFTHRGENPAISG